MTWNRQDLVVPILSYIYKPGHGSLGNLSKLRGKWIPPDYGGISSPPIREDFHNP